MAIKVQVTCNELAPNSHGICEFNVVIGGDSSLWPSVTAKDEFSALEYGRWYQSWPSTVMIPGQVMGGLHRCITSSPPEVTSKRLYKNMLLLLLAYTVLMLFSLYMVLRASTMNTQYPLAEYVVRDDAAPIMVTHNLTVSTNNGTEETRNDTSGRSLQANGMINCSLSESLDHFLRHVQSVLRRLGQDESTAVLLKTEGAYDPGNVAEYIVEGICMTGTSVSSEQHRRLLETIMNATATNVTTPTRVDAYPRPQIQQYYRSVLDDSQTLDLHCETCALVSSSGRILGPGAGGDIDSHACVIRMNGAPTRGFEADVGSRTTIRLGSFMMAPGLRGSEDRFLFGEERGEYNLYWGLENKQKLRMKLRDAMKKNGSRRDVYYGRPEGEDWQNEVFQNMTGRHRDKSKTWLSTGWFTFQLALDVCDKLDVYGMIPEDYCSQHSTIAKFHYYQPGQKPMECTIYKSLERSKKHAHRFMTEKAVFARWAFMYGVSFQHPRWNLSEKALRNISTPFMSLQPS